MNMIMVYTNNVSPASKMNNRISIIYILNTYS